ncbi:MAG TPA: glucokinase [Thermoanaerobaculia bacterium]
MSAPRLLAGDLGGTKTLLRCVEGERVVAEERFESGGYAAFDELLREFLRGAKGSLDAACFAVAGPVIGQQAELTNLGWKLDAAALANAFRIGRVSLVNDFYAVALGTPLLGTNDLLPLHEAARDRNAPIGILGAGTGLGEAIVAPFDGAYRVIPSEGGHGDFAPQDEEQARLLIHLQQRYGHVSWERVVSGQGLVNIFTFLGGEEIEAAEIAELASKGEAQAKHAFEIFVDCYGAEAGNLALRVLARGGVFLAGGIAAKNREWFTGGRFVEAFLRKGRFRKLLETVPVDLIVNEQVGLIGALEGARQALRAESR